MRARAEKRAINIFLDVFEIPIMTDSLEFKKNAPEIKRTRKTDPYVAGKYDTYQEHLFVRKRTAHMRAKDLHNTSFEKNDGMATQYTSGLGKNSSHTIVQDNGVVVKLNYKNGQLIHRKVDKPKFYSSSTRQKPENPVKPRPVTSTGQKDVEGTREVRRERRAAKLAAKRNTPELQEQARVANEDRLRRLANKKKPILTEADASYLSDFGGSQYESDYTISEYDSDSDLDSDFDMDSVMVKDNCLNAIEDIEECEEYSDIEGEYAAIGVLRQSKAKFTTLYGCVTTSDDDEMESEPDGIKFDLSDLLQRYRRMKAIQTESFSESFEGAFYQFLGTLSNIAPIMNEVIIDFGHLLYRLYTCTCASDGFVAIVMTMRSMFNIKVDKLMIAMEPLLEIVKEYFGYNDIFLEAFSDTASRAQMFFNSVITCNLMEVIRNIVLQIASMKFFDKKLASGMFSFFGKPKAMSILEGVEYIFQQIVSLASMGDKIHDGVCVVDVLFGENPNAEFVRSAGDLLKFKDRLYTGLPVEDKMHSSIFVTSCKDHIETAKALEDRLPKSSPIRKEIKDLRFKLTDAKVSAAALANMSSRHMPYSIVVGGDPGIGKSDLVTYMFNLWCKVTRPDVKFEMRYVFCRSSTSDYCDGYDPDQHFGWRNSELGNTADNIAKTQGDPRIMEFTSLADTLPFLLNVAFDGPLGKGKLYARPEIMVTDSNNVDMNLKWLVKNVAAHQRRHVYVIPTVKQEFRRPNSTALNSSLSLSCQDPILDRYTFHVYRMIPNGNMAANPDNLLSGGSIYDLTRVLMEDMRNHIINQTTVRQRMIDECQPEVYMSGEPIAVESAYYDVITAVDKRIESWAFLRKLVPIILLDLYLHFDIYLFYCVFHWFISFPLIIFFVIERCFGRSPYHKLVAGIVAGYYLVIILILMLLREYVPCFLISFLAKQGINYELNCQIGYYKNKLKGAPEIEETFRSKYKDKLGWFYENEGRVRQAVLGVGGALILYKIMFGRKDKRRNVLEDEFLAETYMQSESKTEFLLPDEHNLILNELEEKFDCGNSYARIPNALTEQWNTQEVNEVTCVHKDEPHKLYNLAVSNCRAARVFSIIDGQKTSITTNIIGLSGGDALINSHAIAGSDIVIRVSTISGPNTPLDNNFRDFTLKPKDIIRLEDDQCIISLGMRFKNLIKHIYGGEFSKIPYRGYFNNKEVLATYQVEDVRMRDGRTMEDFKVSALWHYRFDDHAAGKCGMPLIVKIGSGSAFVGIHSGGRHQETAGYAVVLNKRRILEALNNRRINTSLMPFSDLPDKIIDLPILTESLSKPLQKSPFRFVNINGMRYFGKDNMPVMINQKSRVTKTKFYHRIDSEFSKRSGLIRTKTFGPPLMKPTNINGEYISPINNFLNSASQPKAALDSEIMDKVVKLLIDRFSSMLKERGVQLQPITICDAINGPELDPLIRRLNAATSAGYGGKGKKSKYLPLVQEAERYIREPNSSVKFLIMERLLKYSRRLCASPINKLTLKDEAREITKIIAGKTRPFCASELVHLIISRMFLAPFFSAMVEHGDIFCSAVGINMFSQVDEFVEYISFYEKIMEGDYGTFDVRMPFLVGHGAASVIYGVYKEFGFNDHALSVVQGILTDNLFPVVSINGDIVEIAGYQPSGKLGTAEENCIRNLILLMYCWYSLPATKDYDFFEFNRPRTYGDDLLNSVHDRFTKYFNNNVYKKFCEEVYFIKYTNAQKDEYMPDFVTLDTCSFLKRNFVFREDLGHWTAILDSDSLFKVLMWTIPSNFVHEQEQMLGAVTSVCWELALRFQKAQYVYIVEFLGSILSEYYFMGEQVELPSYESIISRIFPNIEL